MEFTDIGYRGQFLPIPPVARLNSDAGLFLLGTSYGNPGLTNEIFDEWEREYLSSTQDLDVTSPFPKLTCLDGMANRIYTTVLYLNDYIYNQYNKEEYSEGFEFLVLQKYNSRLYWTQIGWPLMFLNNGRYLTNLDSSLGFRAQDSHLSPNIPSQLFGVERSINFRVESINIREKEDLFFVKSNSLPTNFFEDVHSQSNENIIRSLYDTQPEQGAWVGRLSFKKQVI